jgi:hypothetical protein
MRTERSLSDFLGGLGGSLALLHHFIDDERLSEKALSLRRLHCGATEIRIANHDDRKPLRLPCLRIGDKDSVLDRDERREDLAHLLDRHTGVEVSHKDLEHRHGIASQPHLEAGAVGCRSTATRRAR